MIRYCPECGSNELVKRVPPRDDRERSCCEQCGYVHYVGPALAAGAILRDGEKICLVRRELEPGRGKWTFPGGFVDIDEAPEAAARRETVEETGYAAKIDRIVGVYNSLGPRGKRVVIIVYAATLTGEAAPQGHLIEEVSEVRWFHRDELPWDEFAFPSTAEALKTHLADSG